MPFKPQSFGRYYLTDLIALGGMAEVTRAIQFGSNGFEKRIALKRILPQFNSDEKFISMLTDEAKLTVSLNHPNIVQFYDFGKIVVPSSNGTDEQYFISMELIDGIDLKTLISKIRSQKKQIPEEILVHIISQVALGLHYAHEKKNEKHEPLNIVHRDMSPQNILISFDGQVKIADFGIAKAASNTSHTRSGAIKGKVCYMAPEQVRAEILDGRCDIYALGLVFYEALTLKRFFDGDSQVEVLKKVRDTEIKEETISESLHPEIKKILLKMLSFHKEDRYQNGYEIFQDCSRFLTKHHPQFNTVLFKNWILENFKKEYKNHIENLTPPVSAEIKQRLSNYSSTDIMAHSEITTEIPTENLDSKTALVYSGKKIFWPFFFLSLVLFLFVDFLSPSIRLSPFLLGVTAILGIFYYSQNIKKFISTNPLPKLIVSSNGQVFIFILLSIFIWGVLTFVSMVSPKRGVLASISPEIARLQDRILVISNDLETIKKQNEEISKQLSSLRKNTPTIPVKKELNLSVEDMGSSLSITLIPSEAQVRRILYSLDEGATWMDTGQSGGSPNFQVNLKRLPEGIHNLWAKYVDHYGNESPLQKTTFQLNSFRVQFKQKAYSPGDTHYDVDVVFHEPNYTENFVKYIYSVDHENLDKSIEKPLIHLNVTKGDHTFFVKGVRKDGTESEVVKQTFSVP